MAIEVGTIAEQIAVALLQLLLPSLASEILTALGLQSGGTAAQEHLAFAIESTVLDNQIDIRDSVHGLAKIASVISTMGGDYTTILDRLTAIESSIGSLPIPPGADTNAAAVWGYLGPGDTTTTWQHLSWIERYAALTSQYGSWPWWQDPMFSVSGSFKYPPD